ncbi:MAG: hypothetical protein EHM38_04250, partial [Geobacteraceae bacterium]
DRSVNGKNNSQNVDKSGQALLKVANVGQDAGLGNTKDKDAFIAAAKTRQGNREETVRPLAWPPVPRSLFCPVKPPSIG